MSATTVETVQGPVLTRSRGAYAESRGGEGGEAPRDAAPDVAPQQSSRVTVS